jgi:hypothetical protein
MLASVTLSMLLLFMWASQDADASVTETYSYLESKGSTSIPIEWHLEIGDHLTVTYTRADEAPPGMIYRSLPINGNSENRARKPEWLPKEKEI